MFFNYFNQTHTNDAVYLERNGRWYIKPGFAGANTSYNNSCGYETKEKAESVILRYQSK